jgi:VanZ family protein
MPVLRYAMYWWFIGGLLVGTVITLSLIPNHSLPSMGISDKIEHLTAYGVLMGYFCNLRYQAKHRILCAIGLSLMGVLLEFAQAQVGREYDVVDMQANCLGVAIAWAVMYTPLGRITAWVDARLPQ